MKKCQNGGRGSVKNPEKMLMSFVHGPWPEITYHKIIETNSVPCCPLSFCTKQARIVDSNEEGWLVAPALCAAGFPSNGDTLQLTSKCQSHNSLLNHNGTRINIKSCFTLYSPQRGLNTSSYKCSIQSWLVFTARSWPFKY